MPPSTPLREPITPNESQRAALRERAALFALQGLLACPDALEGDDIDAPRLIAARAVEYADALTAALYPPHP